MTVVTMTVVNMTVVTMTVVTMTVVTMTVVNMTVVNMTVVNRHDIPEKRHVMCSEGVPRYMETPEAHRARLSKSRA